MMKRSTERILTTHTGSLPRPPDLVEMMQARDSEQPVDSQLVAARVWSALAEVVHKQLDTGIDVVNDGEFGKPGFNVYVIERLSGLGGENREPRIRGETEDFPAWSRDTAGQMSIRPMCIGPVSYRGRQAVEKDIQNLKSALRDSPGVEAFLPCASPGTIEYTIANRHYPSSEAYLFALANAMKEEYQAVAKAGLLLQIDAPDHAMDRSISFRTSTVEEFRKAQAIRVEALNHALEGIPEEQIRYHICWGNYEGPHTRDIPLRDIIDLLFRVRAGAYVVESSNPRHAHEWQVWQDTKLPAGKILIAGVIDTTTNFVEHPELVAQRIERFARILGRENVMAGTDCGFSTFAGRARVHPEIVWGKLGSLVEGARLATERLWA